MRESCTGDGGDQSLPGPAGDPGAVHNLAGPCGDTGVRVGDTDRERRVPQSLPSEVSNPELSTLTSETSS